MYLSIPNLDGFVLAHTYSCNILSMQEDDGEVQINIKLFWLLEGVGCEDPS